MNRVSAFAHQGIASSSSADHRSTNPHLRLGYRVSLNLASNTGGLTSDGAKSTNTLLALGAGATYAINRNVDVTAEVERFNHLGDASTTGRRYHFMRGPPLVAGCAE